MKHKGNDPVAQAMYRLEMALDFPTTLYNPRHVPTLIGPVYITSTHVIIDIPVPYEEDDTPPLKVWWNETMPYL